jgi:hypothetical protein
MDAHVRPSLVKVHLAPFGENPPDPSRGGDVGGVAACLDKLTLQAPVDLLAAPRRVSIRQLKNTVSPWLSWSSHVATSFLLVSANLPDFFILTAGGDGI